MLDMSESRVTSSTILLCSLLLLASGAGPVLAQEPETTPLDVVVRTYDREKLLASLTAPDGVRKGRALWLQRCAFCHDGVGQPTYNTMGPWIGAETVRLLGPDAVRAIVNAGTEQMPGFQYALQPVQIGQLIEFLQSMGVDQKPTPGQLARKSSGAVAAAGAK